MRTYGQDVVREHTQEPSLETEWIQSWVRGEPEGLAKLYQHYGAFVHAAVFRHAPELGRDEVEDVCQDVFLSVFESARRYREKGRFRSWLYAVAVHKAKDVRRRRRLKNWLFGREGGDARDWPDRAPVTDPEGRLMLQRALTHLTDAQREVLWLYEVEGFSGEEIAQATGANLNTIWSHLRRARQRLAEEFENPIPEKTP